VVILLVAAGWWWSARPGPDVGTSAARALAGATESGSASGVDPAGATVSASGRSSTVPTQPATLPTATDPVQPPIKLTIPALGLTARVIPVGVAADGQFDVPPSVDTVGWYRYGPGLDAVAGSIAVAGHVDGAGQGPGAFFNLRRLAPGDSIQAAGADGRTWSGPVGADLEVLPAIARRLAKAGVPLAELRLREPGLRGAFFRLTGRELGE
jgi:hypothetical protein